MDHRLRVTGLCPQVVLKVFHVIIVVLVHNGSF